MEFKVGDVVVVVKQANNGTLPVGYVGTITNFVEDRISGGICYQLDNVGGGWLGGGSGGELKLLKSGYKPRPHADLIKAWADGAEIEYKNSYGAWVTVKNTPTWLENGEYRIKESVLVDEISKLREEIDISQKKLQDLLDSL